MVTRAAPEVDSFRRERKTLLCPLTMYFRILTPTGNDRGPIFMESILKTLHLADSNREGVKFRIDSHAGTTQLAVECPPNLKTVVTHELQDSYPGLEVRRSSWGAAGGSTVSIELRKHPDVFVLKSYTDFADETNHREYADPLSGILSALQSGRSGQMSFTMELEIRPAHRRRLKAAVQIRKRLSSVSRPAGARNWYLALAERRSVWLRFLSHFVYVLTGRRGQHSQNDPETGADAVFECRLVLTATAASNASQIAARRLSEIAGAFARFSSPQTRFISAPIGKRYRWRPTLMTAGEIASIWHPPTKTTDSVVRVSRGNFRELEPPGELHAVDHHDAVVLGRVRFRKETQMVCSPIDDLRRHLIAVGKTGCGKSTFLLNMVRQQMEAGRGVVLIDPHGQLAEEVLDVVPKRRTNDVIYFDASDRIAPVGFNPMTGPPGTDPTLIADGVLTSFKNVFGFDEGSAPRLLHIFRNCLLSLIGTPHASLMNVQRMLVDANFRKSIVALVRNDTVREFWLTEFNRWNDRDRTQYVASLQNKLGAFLTNQRLRAILEPGQEGIQLRHIMDHSGILICNLSKGTFGHDASTLLGSLLLSSLQVAAMSRADIPESERTDCVIVVDEFHSYLAEGNSTMADALAESRKYRTSYVLSTQMLDGQLDSATLAGVLGNCGSTLCMTVGPRDAELLAGLLGSGLTPEDLMRIPKYHGYLRMLIDGAPHTFSMTTMPPPKYTTRRAATIRRVSRERYGRMQPESKALS